MPDNTLTKTAFKTCGTCDTRWITRTEFIGCRFIKLVGYQSNFDKTEEGLFLFNHLIDICGTTLAVPVEKFGDLYTGEKYAESRFGTDECEKRCIDKFDLERCNARCKYAYVREILQILRNS